MRPEGRPYHPMLSIARDGPGAGGGAKQVAAGGLDVQVQQRSPMSGGGVRESPDPRVQGKVLPQPHKPGLRQGLALLARQLALVFIVVVVRACPGGLGLGAPGNQGGAGRCRSVQLEVPVVGVAR